MRQDDYLHADSFGAFGKLVGWVAAWACFLAGRAGSLAASRQTGQWDRFGGMVAASHLCMYPPLPPSPLGTVGTENPPPPLSQNKARQGKQEGQDRTDGRTVWLKMKDGTGTDWKDWDREDRKA